MSRTVIVGAGVIGLACAHALRKRGEDVVMIDSGAPGDGCSKGNAGWVTPSLAEPLPAPGLTWTSLRWMLDRDSPLHIDPLAAPRMAPWLWSFWRHCNQADYEKGHTAWGLIADRATESFDALVADGVDFEMHRSGLLFVFLREATMRGLLRDIRAARRSDGNGPEPLVGAELRRFEPGLSANAVAGFWLADERHVRPESLCAGLAQRLSRLGVEMHSGVTATDGVSEGQSLRALRTTNGDVTGDRFLIAAGARTGIVSDAVAGFPLPIQAGKGYSITVTAAASPMQRPLYLDEAKLGCSPFDGGYRFAGTMELSGINERLVPERVAAIRRAAQRYLTLPPNGTTGVEWVGMRPVAPDGLPVIGRLPNRSNVYIATGHQMLGVTTALTTATLMADLIVDGRTAVDLRAIDPARFAH